ncbi:hypothetical protein [Proteiniborus sp.]|uniref:hypothetical protein n=1 Tax=Proteiniborus sp. TaxID=2079015 RepID=UPI0033292ABF
MLDVIKLNLIENIISCDWKHFIILVNPLPINRVRGINVNIKTKAKDTIEK